MRLRSGASSVALGSRKRVHLASRCRPCTNAKAGSDLEGRAFLRVRTRPPGSDLERRLPASAYPPPNRPSAFIRPAGSAKLIPSLQQATSSALAQAVLEDCSRRSRGSKLALAGSDLPRRRSEPAHAPATTGVKTHRGSRLPGRFGHGRKLDTASPCFYGVKNTLSYGL